MDAKSLLAFSVNEDVDTVVRISVPVTVSVFGLSSTAPIGMYSHWAHDEARVVGTYGYQTQVKRTAELSDLLERRTNR